MVGRDPRVRLLAKSLGWSVRETVGCLVIDVWPICYDQMTHLISERVLDAAADREGFATALIESELAHRDRSGKVYVAGAKKRIKYLEDKQRAGHEGGVKSAESRRKTPKQTSSTSGSTPQARRNPPVPDPFLVPDSAPDPVVVPEKKEKSSAAPISRKSKEPSYTEHEQASVRVILDRLSERSGVKYQGSKEHTRLIVARLRDGCSEWDLRRVIGYCAERLKWEEKPEMRAYLRPETLFGPQTIAKYLDPARTAFPESAPTDEPIASSRASPVIGDSRPDPFETTADPMEEPPWMTA